MLGDGTRQRTRVFSELQSHYLFDDRFGRPGKGNDKGKVEGLVGYARRNFFVPVPRFASWDALNLDLANKCRARRGRRLRRHTETFGERFARDRQALLPLPPVPYDACDQRSTRVTSLSLVRDRRNDYSVPTAYGHRAVVVKGDVDEVVIVCGSEEIARHRRSYDREVLIFDPRHYVALLERKTGALDQAAPLVGWALPEEFLRLRRLVEARLGKPGTREYVQVLRRLEDFRLAHVRGAVRDAALVHGSRALGEPRSTSWPSWRQQVHDLDMKSRVHPKYKTKYHVGNWPAYDRALVQRGDITVWLAPDAIATWEAVGVGKRGGQRQYSDLAIETALTLRLIFHLPLRQTEGFLTSIFGMLGLDLSRARSHHALPAWPASRPPAASSAGGEARRCRPASHPSTARGLPWCTTPLRAESLP